MDAVKHLMEEIHRMQSLVYLARQDEETVPVRDLMAVLRLSPASCAALVSTLAREGLVQAVPSDAHPLPRAVRVTEAGQARVRRWRVDQGAGNLHATPMG